MASKLTPGAEAFIRAVTEFVFVENLPEKADVILIPGSRHPEHAIRAAELYLQGYAPWVLPSGRFAIGLQGFENPPDAAENFESEWAYLRWVLMNHGVPEQAILREDQASFTWDNAQKSRAVTDRMGLTVHRAILCCRSFHARRALLYYQAAFEQTSFVVCPVQEKDCGRDDWYLSEQGRARVLGEVRRLGSQVNLVFESMLQENPAMVRID